MNEGNGIHEQVTSSNNETLGIARGEGTPSTVIVVSEQGDSNEFPHLVPESKGVAPRFVICKN